jgi:hypothetical protein
MADFEEHESEASSSTCEFCISTATIRRITYECGCSRRMLICSYCVSEFGGIHQYGFCEDCAEKWTRGADEY